MGSHLKIEQRLLLNGCASLFSLFELCCTFTHSFIIRDSFLLYNFYTEFIGIISHHYGFQKSINFLQAVIQ